MSELYPQEDTQDTREGNATHWGGQQLLTGNAIDVGLIADNGVTLDADMVDGAQMWADHVSERGAIGNVEVTITKPALHPENWGTPDHWLWDVVNYTLYVDDFKYGHRFVEVWKNWQLINYAALILNELGLMRAGSVRVIFTIVQPRSYHRQGPIRTWATTVDELRPLWCLLAEAFYAAKQPNALCTPKAEACRDCTGRWACEAAQAATYVGVDMSRQSEPLELSPAALSREYKMLLQAESFIKSRREGIADRVMRVIRRQQSVPHFMIDHRPGREVWQDDAMARGVVDFCAAFGVDITRPDLITPRQAIKAGVPKEVVELFSKTNSGAIELVEDDGSTAAKAFNPK